MGITILFLTILNQSQYGTQHGMASSTKKGCTTGAGSARPAVSETSVDEGKRFLYGKKELKTHASATVIIKPDTKVLHVVHEFDFIVSIATHAVYRVAFKFQ
jgi:hypothetical protein